MPGEFDYIEWLRARTPADPRVLRGPGDDCALLAPTDRPILITTDMLMDGTDFVVAEVGPRRAGRKAMAANLSDIAAMAGTPVAAVAAVALPRDGGLTFAEDLYLGLRDVADEFGVPIVGGDTNSWNGPFVIAITVIGEVAGRGAVTRAGARAGDWLFVTGPLGGSILGRHLDFTPRIREALALHAAVELHAMCDISDGLAADLQHILQESHTGAVLDAGAIPISRAARELSGSTGKPPLLHALGDGEDYELLFAVAAEDGQRLLRDSPVSGLVKVGECVEAGLWLQTDGKRERLAPMGWVHPLADS